MTDDLNIPVRSKFWFCPIVLLFIAACLSTVAYAGKMSTSHIITLFMGGDIMTGRGIDQVLAYPGDPRLYESFVKDARR